MRTFVQKYQVKEVVGRLLLMPLDATSLEKVAQEMGARPGQILHLQVEAQLLQPGEELKQPAARLQELPPPSPRVETIVPVSEPQRVEADLGTVRYDLDPETRAWLEESFKKLEITIVATTRPMLNPGEPAPPRVKLVPRKDFRTRPLPPVDAALLRELQIRQDQEHRVVIDQATRSEIAEQCGCPVGPIQLAVERLRLRTLLVVESDTWERPYKKGPRTTTVVLVDVKGAV